MKLDSEILIVGAGFAGIGAAMYLMRNGFDDFAIVDRASEIGGTWRDNIYPGVAADIPVIYYSFSFEKRSYWSTFYAPQKDLFRYSLDLVEKYNLRPRISFNVSVERAVYDADNNVWVTHFADGTTFVSRYLITATGGFSVSRNPDIQGMETFEGDVFHSTAWMDKLDLSGKRVAIIGTGATGVQIIPELAEVVGRLDVYQRTPSWVLPKPSKPISPGMRWALQHVPGFQSLLRIAAFGLVDIPLFSILTKTKSVRWLQRYLQAMCLRHIERGVPSEELREKLTPKFDFGCRRPTFSNTYYPAFSRSNVDLVTARIGEIRKNSIVTADGVEREIDALVCATGFSHVKTTVPTFPVYGLNGRLISDVWEQDGPRTYKGVSVAGFPNYFMINAPFCVASLSWINMIENTMTHIIRVLRGARSTRANYIRVRPEAVDVYFGQSTEGMKGHVFNAGNCVGAMQPGVERRVGGLRSSNSLGAWFDARLFSLSDYEFSTK